MAVLQLCAQVAAAQSSGQALEWYTKARQAVEQGTAGTDSLKSWLEYSIREERKSEKPDPVFVGDCLEEIASLYHFSAPATLAYRYHWEALGQYLEGGETEKALRQLGELEGIAREAIGRNQIFNPFAQQGEQQDLGHYVPIREVVRLGGDSFRLRIQAGSAQGVKLGFQGGILSSDHKLIQDRGNRVLGSFTISSVEANHSTAIALLQGETAIEILPGDNAYLLQSVPVGTHPGVLFELSRLNVLFTRNNLKSFYQVVQLQSLHSYVEEERILKLMLADIRSTALTLKTRSESDQQSPPLAGGRFSKTSLYDAMAGSTVADLRAYFRFVRAYPARYMGRNFRLDETYATWIIHGTPGSEREGQSSFPEAGALLNDFLYQHRDSTAQWVADNAYYLNRCRGFDQVFTVHIQQVRAGGLPDSALSLCAGLQRIAEGIGSDSLLVTALTQRGLVRYHQGNYDSAIAHFSHAITLGVDTLRAYWWRGHAYEKQSSVGKATDDFGVLIRGKPDFAGGHGAYGWTLIKSGKFRQATPYCRKAFELDSTELAWRINYGHCYLLNGRTDSAWLFYERSLHQIRETQVFQTHFEADFDIFLQNGWQEEELIRIRAQLRQAWNLDVLHRVKADSLFHKGADYANDGHFRKAAGVLDLALAAEKLRPDPRLSLLREMYRMRGRCAFQLNEKRDMHELYRKAYQISRDSLQDPALQLEDLDDLAFIYQIANDKVRHEMATDNRRKLSRYLDDLAAGNNLYLISVGLNTYPFPGYRWAEKDAQDVHKLFGEQGPRLFDRVHRKLLIGDSASRDQIREALNQVIRESKYGDCFIFYFAGYAGEGAIRLKGDSIQAWELKNWIQSMRSRKQLIVLDAPGSAFHRAFSNAEIGASLYDDTRDLHLICPDGVRLESDSPRQGHLTSMMLKIMTANVPNGISRQGTLSVKSLEYALFQTRDGAVAPYFLTYSRGADFNILRLTQRPLEQDTIAPGILLTSAIITGLRGAKARLHKSGNILEGRVYDNVQVSTLFLNGEPIPFYENGKFSIDRQKLSGTSFTLQAWDESGNTNRKVFYLDDLPQYAAETGSSLKRGRNYAVLFATNSYNDWSDLVNPVADAEAIGELLRRDYGFSVQIIRNPDRAELLDSLYSCLNRNYGPRDQLFLFFAGHGMNDPNLAGQLVCKDSRLQDHRTLPSYVPFHFITDNFDRNNCPHVFLAMDVCFGGAYFDHQSAPRYLDSEVERIGREAFIERKSMYKSRQFLSSGGNEYVPDGKPGQHSPFTTKFLETLEAGRERGYVTLIDFVDHMRMISTQPRYGSFGSHHPDGEFVFEYNKTEGAEPQASSALKAE